VRCKNIKFYPTVKLKTDRKKSTLTPSATVEKLTRLPKWNPPLDIWVGGRLPPARMRGPADQWRGGSLVQTKVFSILKHKGSNVVTAVADQNIASFAALLFAHKIGAAPVLDAENHVVGIISERDVIRGIVEHGTAVLTLPVSALITRLVSTCSLNDRIGDVLEMITVNRTRHVPVVDNGKLEGIISIGDVVKQLLEEAQFEVESLQTYITRP